jgi:hypothetical protein
VLVLKFRAHHSTSYGAHDTMSTKLIATKVPSCAAAQSTHQTSVALSLCVRVGAAVLLLARLSVGVWWLCLSLGVLVCRIGALLGELVLRLRSRVCTLLRLTVLPGDSVRYWLENVRI